MRTRGVHSPFTHFTIVQFVTFAKCTLASLMNELTLYRIKKAIMGGGGGCDECYKTSNLHQNPSFLISLPNLATYSYPTDHVAINPDYGCCLLAVMFVCKETALTTKTLNNSKDKNIPEIRINQSF